MSAFEKKIKILFVCHGNICRSPMAEFIMKQLVEDAGVSDRFEIGSCAVSTEEIGNDIYPPAKRKLCEKGVPFTRHYARQITLADYTEYDYVICMDKSNIRLLHFVVGDDTKGKVSLLMQWCKGESDLAGGDMSDKPNKGLKRRLDVADPWYTGDFETTYRDIVLGCNGLLNRLKANL